MSSQPHLELRLLGVPEILLDGRPVVLTRRSAVALLAYLVVTEGNYPREILTALFGGDESEEQARKRLSNALADLRQQLPECLMPHWHIVGLRPEVTCTVDVVDFEAQLTQARNQLDHQSLRDAAGLYRGEFMSGMSLASAPDFEMWLLLHRESYHAQLVQTLEALAESDLRHADWANGAWAAQRVVALEPWHEEAHRQLMLLLARSGQRHAALAQYEVCRRMLRQELDTEPSPETVAVYQELKRFPDIPNNLAAPPTECVGREDEVELLTNRLSARGARLLSITGPSGSGTSRLALDVASRFVHSEQSPFTDGVFQIAAAGKSAEQVCRDVAAALSVPADGQPVSPMHLAVLLRPLHVLLVLDGIEPAPEFSSLVSELLSVAPGLTVLASARSALGIDGEQVLHIAGLRLPSDAADVELAPASRVLLAEARRADLRFQLQAEDQHVIVRLCQLVRGLPLGLVLAGRALSETTGSALAEAVQSALSDGLGAHVLASWAPRWSMLIETLQRLDPPVDATPLRDMTPLAVVCAPDGHAERAIAGLRREGLLVCVTHDEQGCLRIATAIAPSVVVLDRRLPERLEALLRTDPVSRGATIRWLGEPQVERQPARVSGYQVS